tara:strand:- start:1542 stop:2444 length:903 start_codon:yes stop_codon:yes gene_type:complete
MKIHNIDINKVISDNLDGDIYKKIYNIDLKKGTTYFIALCSYNNNDLNLRLFDKNKNNIKFKYDKDEKINYIDFECNENYKKINDSSSNNLEEANELVEKNNNDFLTDNELSELINDILSKYIKDLDNEIELVIEFDETKDSKDTNNNISENDIIKIRNKIENKPYNFNNKICFKANYTGNYYIMVSSDYNKIETQYFLSIQETENINNFYNKQIKLNEKITYNSKLKFNIKLFKIKLKSDVKYNIKSENKVIYLVYNNKQKLISKNNDFSFGCNYNGLFTIEIISLEENNIINFIISEL